MLGVIYNRIAIVLSFAGLFVAGVLSMGAAFEKDIPCGMSHGCSVVAAHPSSHMLGVPNAYLGFLAYFVLAAFAVSREIVGIKRSSDINLASLIISGLGALFSLFLTYISITQIHATCIWCLSSLAIILALTALNFMLFRSSPGADAAEPPKMPGIVVIAVSLVAFLGLSGWQYNGLASEVGGLYTPPPGSYTQADVDQLTGPNAHVINPNGKVTLIEFGDLVCPICRRLFAQVEQMVMASNGNIRYSFHHFPLYKNPQHVNALPAAMLAEMCADKGKFYEYIQACYSGTDPKAPDPTLDDFKAFATMLGLDVPKAEKRMVDDNDPAFKRVQDDLDIANKFGVRATPTFLLIVPGKKLGGVVGEKLFEILKRPEYKQYFGSAVPAGPAPGNGQ